MLTNLHVKNLAIIDEVEVDFKENLNIMTGETGAGKSIIIGSINIALGGKVSKDIIRKGAEYALVELVFELKDENVIKKMNDMGIFTEEGQVILSRKITPQRSISRINGEHITASAIREISGMLIDIHGQHEHQSLLQKNVHLQILDRYSKEQIGDLKEKLEQAYKKYFELKQELESTSMDEEKRLREISFLEYELNEIETAKLKPNEEEQLTSLHKKLSNLNTIASELSSVHGLTSKEDSSVANCIGRASKTIGKLIEYDDNIEPLFNQLSELESLINDFNRDLYDYCNSLELDEENYYNVEERLTLIHNLKSKYGKSIVDILEYYEVNKEKLTKYKEYDNYIEKLQKEFLNSKEKVEKLSKQLSQIRNKNGKQLSKQIEDSLIDLNFLEVKFQVQFNKVSHYTPNGYDEVEFMISTNPGEDVKPLSKVASGGELSRVMLAIKSVLAENDAIYTLIFDEIDAGISGRTAQKVSEKLAFISKNHQILCITHLPQIAAMADAHYIIEKSSQNDITKTNIYMLSEDQSIDELARMLGGAKITDTVIDSAREMKTLALNTKNF